MTVEHDFLTQIMEKRTYNGNYIILIADFDKITVLC